MAVDGNSGVSPSIATGTYAGTTAAQTIEVGFAPSALICWNVTDGDDVNLWHKSMTTTFINIAAAAASVSAVVSATDHGFTLPASDNDINENGKTYAFIAIR